MEILAADETDRIPELVPVRYGRMTASPFSFLVGAPGVMAADLAGAATSGLSVQLCGDAHLGNFAPFGSAARGLIFDIRDFDETMVGPWEHDLRRLAASVVVVARESGRSEEYARSAVTALAFEYRLRLREYAQMRTLELWDSSVPGRGLVEPAPRTGERAAAGRRGADQGGGYRMPARSGLVDASRQTRESRPVVVRLHPDEQHEARAAYLRFVDSLPEERQHLIRRFTLDDVAWDVTGVARVGIRRFVLMLHGNDAEDSLRLQLRQATRSVWERTGRSRFGHHARRVIVGQRLIQSTPDVFLGWTSGARGRNYCVRQLSETEAAGDPVPNNGRRLAERARRCAWVLARAHARTGDPVTLVAYLDKGDAFDRALVGFAVDYADQTERDHAALRRAVLAGRVRAEQS